MTDITDAQRAAVYRELARKFKGVVFDKPDLILSKWADELDGEDYEWLDSLPDAYRTGGETPFFVAILNLNRALLSSDSKDYASMLTYSQRAAAEVVDWRENLAVQGERERNTVHGGDRELLRDAIRYLLSADRERGSEEHYFLRFAEALLAELWRRNK